MQMAMAGNFVDEFFFRPKLMKIAGDVEASFLSFETFDVTHNQVKMSQGKQNSEGR